MLPLSAGKEFLVKFDSQIELPVVEVCFLTLTLPSKHKAFEDFAKHMDIALKFGSKGFTFSQDTPRFAYNYFWLRHYMVGVGLNHVRAYY